MQGCGEKAARGRRGRETAVSGVMGNGEGGAGSVHPEPGSAPSTLHVSSP